MESTNHQNQQNNTLKIDLKWKATKVTNNGIVITIAESSTRKGLIDKLKEDSETFKREE